MSVLWYSCCTAHKWWFISVLHLYHKQSRVCQKSHELAACCQIWLGFSRMAACCMSDVNLCPIIQKTSLKGLFLVTGAPSCTKHALKEDSDLWEHLIKCMWCQFMSELLSQWVFVFSVSLQLMECCVNALVTSFKETILAECPGMIKRNETDSEYRCTVAT